MQLHGAPYWPGLNDIGRTARPLVSPLGHHGALPYGDWRFERALRDFEYVVVPVGLGVALKSREHGQMEPNPATALAPDAYVDGVVMNVSGNDGAPPEGNDPPRHDAEEPDMEEPQDAREGAGSDQENDSNSGSATDDVFSSLDPIFLPLDAHWLARHRDVGREDQFPARAQRPAPSTGHLQEGSKHSHSFESRRLPTASPRTPLRRLSPSRARRAKWGASVVASDRAQTASTVGASPLGSPVASPSVLVSSSRAAPTTARSGASSSATIDCSLVGAAALYAPQSPKQTSKHGRGAAGRRFSAGARN